MQAFFVWEVNGLTLLGVIRGGQNGLVHQGGNLAQLLSVIHYGLVGMAIVAGIYLDFVLV